MKEKAGEKRKNSNILHFDRISFILYLLAAMPADIFLFIKNFVGFLAEKVLPAGDRKTRRGKYC